MAKILIVGKSGSGKSTLTKFLAGKGFKIGKFTTTRPQRDESESLIYDFTTKEEFMKRLNDVKIGKEKGRFKVWHVYGEKEWLYGITESEYDSCDVCEFTPAYLKQLSQEDLNTVLVIYFDVDDETRLRRAKGRKGDTDKFESRIASDNKQFEGFSTYDISIKDLFYKQLPV
ncbi:MAG: hypothetical protein EOM74_01940 [Methanomicrobia archaeon]|nr:hypothetical protein [Methanomicrobia archaeon]